MIVSIRVTGDAKTQGSKKAFVRGGKAIMLESAKGLPAWREAIRYEAVLAMKGRPPMVSPCTVMVTVYRQRPKSHYQADGDLRADAPRHPAGRNSGDLDKLVRAIADALTDAGAWADDCQMVALTAQKRWSSPGVAPYALIEVVDLEP